MRICVKKVGALKRRLHYRAVTSPHFYKWWVVDPVGTALRRRVERRRVGRHCNQTAWKPSRYAGCRNCRKTIRYPFLLSFYFLHFMGKKVLTYSVFYVIMKIRIDISFVCDRNRKKLFCQDVQLQLAAQLMNFPIEFFFYHLIFSILRMEFHGISAIQQPGACGRTLPAARSTAVRCPVRLQGLPAPERPAEDLNCPGSVPGNV